MVISTRVVCLIAIATLAFVSGVNAKPVAVAGELDLTTWSFETDGPIDLNGAYEFYWREFIDPSSIKNESASPKYFQEIPGTWDAVESGSQKLSDQGYASYKLTVKLKRREMLSLRFRDAATSYRAYVDGKLLASNGSPGTDKASTQPAFHPQSIDFLPAGKQFVLVLHIANFHYRKGGQWEEITLGPPDQIEELMAEQAAVDWTLFGVLFMIIGGS